VGKINIQRNLGTGSFEEQVGAGGVIDKLAGNMSGVDIGFRPTDQRVYEINLDRITPDPAQPRHLLPHDLRTAVHEKSISPAEAMRELVLRAGRGDIVALLILEDGKRTGRRG
jgi:hypothetical protein